MKPSSEINESDREYTFAFTLTLAYDINHHYLKQNTKAQLLLYSKTKQRTHILN